ncbi:MAG: hypothetical protein NZ455_14940 [Bacteroidia bacterium]|nr:hypothetical protein [Bacteroidia bacterium]
MLNIYLYHPQKKTITFFKIENHKIISPKTILHNGNTQTKIKKQEFNYSPENNFNDHTPHPKKNSKIVLPESTYKQKVEKVQNKVVFVTNLLNKNQKKVIQNKIKQDTLDNKEINQNQLKDEITPQPLYHIKETKNEVKTEEKKPEPIYQEQKFFDYRHPLKTYFEQYTPHSEYLWVVDDKEYVHTTPQNSKIKLHNTVFVDKYGKPTQGDIVLEFKELTNGIEFLKANINTNINEELKHAYRIWYISAKQKNKPVFLGVNTVITVQISSSKHLSFHFGKRNFNGEIEWKPIPQNQVEKVEIMKTKKQGKIYEYYCNLSELGWIAAFYEPHKEPKNVLINLKSPSEVSANQIVAYYVDSQTNYTFTNINQVSFITSKGTQIIKKVKKYAQGILFEGHIPSNYQQGKIIVLAYNKGNYYFAQTKINAHKERIEEMELSPVKENEINEYLCKD